MTKTHIHSIINKKDLYKNINNIIMTCIRYTPISIIVLEVPFLPENPHKKPFLKHNDESHIQRSITLWSSGWISSLKSTKASKANTAAPWRAPQMFGAHD